MVGNLAESNRGNRKRNSQLSVKQDTIFRIAICGMLENSFDFKKMNSSSGRSFHEFIGETVGKSLTVKQVDLLYLRTKGTVAEIKTVHGKPRTILHYGKNRKPFRVFGYYNEDGYFTLTRLDPRHRTHK